MISPHPFDQLLAVSDEGRCLRASIKSDLIGVVGLMVIPDGLQPSERQRAIYDQIIAKEMELNQQMAGQLQLHYSEIRDDALWGADEAYLNEVAEILPLVEGINELAKAYYKGTLYIPEQYEDGINRFSILYDVEWEDEHGVSVNFHNLEFIECGGMNIAF